MPMKISIENLFISLQSEPNLSSEICPQIEADRQTTSSLDVPYLGRDGGLLEVRIANPW